MYHMHAGNIHVAPLPRVLFSLLPSPFSLLPSPFSLLPSPFSLFLPESSPSAFSFCCLILFPSIFFKYTNTHRYILYTYIHTIQLYTLILPSFQIQTIWTKRRLNI